MATRYEILPRAERSLLPSLAPLADLGFVLQGGTAAALRLGHRKSAGFEFAADRPADRAILTAAVPMLADATILYEEPGGWAAQVSPVGAAPDMITLSFSVVSGRVGRPDRDDDGRLLLAAPDDLFAHALEALLRRADTNDLRDLAALIEGGLTLDRGLGAARALYPDMVLSEACKALVYFEAEALGEISPADRRTLVGAVARLTAVADTPLRSRPFDAAAPDASRDSPRSTFSGAAST